MEDTVHGCGYFKNNTEFCWKQMKLFESRGDVRPTTKAENEPSGCILDPHKVRTNPQQIEAVKT